MATRTRMPGIACPHCGSDARTRSGKTITPLVRQLYYYCEDLEGCGHHFVAQLAILHTVRPSDTPNPDVQLPMRVGAWIASIAGAPLPANDEASELEPAMEALNSIG